ncbi:aspartate--tRNA ligase [Candidatus Berkelbacteria bacterium]|nr:aspartate--tRNA ligase [Candidatus Berkelbacteria bacterium]
MDRITTKDTPHHINETITVFGWIHTRRDHGKITFFDLRDRWGLLQIVATDQTNGPVKDIRPEYVVKLTGTIVKRPEKLINPGLVTGTVEMQAESIEVLNAAKTPPFEVDKDTSNVDEETRLKYRYLDLRSVRMTQHMINRHRVAQYIRGFLADRDFLEIDTPILTKSTPEGARDFIVPSRLQPGKFYALPQSPQQYKQLLMVAGLDRYFQLPRCFRDEDPRADRAYGEFTQLDLEMSFVTQEDILVLAEELFTTLVEKLFPEKRITTKPWPRLSHKEAMEKYGTDKPDLRNDKSNPNELAFAWTLDFPLFTEQTKEDFFHGSGGASFAPSHHMFTAPHPDDVPLLDTDPSKVRGLQHDMVLNGYEVGGGSIRIHQAEVQQKIFNLIGFSKEQSASFNHMLEAFTYGVPPHGGIAPGFDRLLMVLAGEQSIREIIPFPAIASGATAVLDAPAPISDEQLKDAHIAVRLSQTSR